MRALLSTNDPSLFKSFVRCLVNITTTMVVTFFPKGQQRWRMVTGLNASHVLVCTSFSMLSPPPPPPPPPPPLARRDRCVVTTPLSFDTMELYHLTRMATRADTALYLMHVDDDGREDPPQAGARVRVELHLHARGRSKRYVLHEATAAEAHADMTLSHPPSSRSICVDSRALHEQLRKLDLMDCSAVRLRVSGNRLLMLVRFDYGIGCLSMRTDNLREGGEEDAEEEEGAEGDDLGCYPVQHLLAIASLHQVICKLMTGGGCEGSAATARAKPEKLMLSYSNRCITVTHTRSLDNSRDHCSLDQSAGGMRAYMCSSSVV